MESADETCADQAGRIVQGDAESSEVSQEPQRKIVALQRMVFTAWARYTSDVLSSLKSPPTIIWSPEDTHESSSLQKSSQKALI